jgi:hypothetical protein
VNREGETAAAAAAVAHSRGDAGLRRWRKKRIKDETRKGENAIKDETRRG